MSGICECYDYGYRHENKYYLSLEEAKKLRARLRGVMKKDAHSDENYRYTITSVYFDTIDNKALKGSVLGVSKRKKYRIRAYNHDDSFISLEKKEKWNNLSKKTSLRISRQMYDDIMYGNYAPLAQLNAPLAKEFYYELVSNIYRPKTIVEYDREIYTYPVSDVRITFDMKIRSSVCGVDMFYDNNMISVFPPYVIVLEVKYNHFLPDFIQQLLPRNLPQRTAVSKYMLGRTYM